MKDEAQQKRRVVDQLEESNLAMFFISVTSEERLMQSIRDQDENVALVEVPIFAPLAIPLSERCSRAWKVVLQQRGRRCPFKRSRRAVEAAKWLIFDPWPELSPFGFDW